MTETPILGFNGSYAFLSNFWTFDAEIDDGMPKVPTTAEHLYQAMKTTELLERIWVLDADTPREAKRRDNLVTLRPDWDEVKIQAMKHVLLLKFKNLELRAKLLDTGERQLVESNWWHDCYWGSCVCNRCEDQPKLNNLGELLMAIRSIYQAAENLISNALIQVNERK